MELAANKAILPIYGQNMYIDNIIIAVMNNIPQPFD